MPGHAILAITDAGFDEVVKALRGIGDASSLHVEVIGSSPRVAVFVGEKRFLRAQTYGAAVTIVIEGSPTTIKIVVPEIERGLFGRSSVTPRDYAWSILRELSQRLRVEVVKEIERYAADRAGELSMGSSA